MRHHTSAGEKKRQAERRALWMSLPSYQKKKPEPKWRGINPISKHRAAQLHQYRAKKKIYFDGLRANNKGLLPWCPVMLEITGEKIRVRDIHHMRGRIGTLLLDERYWLAVSRVGHDWINANPVLARAYGWLCQPGQWNKPVPL